MSSPTLGNKTSQDAAPSKRNQNKYLGNQSKRLGRFFIQILVIFSHRDISR